MGPKLMDPSLISSGVVSQNLKGKEQLIQGQTDEEECDAERKINILNTCMLGIFSVSLNYIP